MGGGAQLRRKKCSGSQRRRQRKNDPSQEQTPDSCIFLQRFHVNPVDEQGMASSGEQPLSCRPTPTMKHLRLPLRLLFFGLEMKNQSPGKKPAYVSLFYPRIGGIAGELICPKTSFAGVCHTKNNETWPLLPKKRFPRWHPGIWKQRQSHLFHRDPYIIHLNIAL